MKRSIIHVVFLVSLLCCTTKFSLAHDWYTPNTPSQPHWYEKQSPLSDKCHFTIGHHTVIHHINPTTRSLPCSFMHAMNTKFVTQHHINPYVVYKFYQAQHLDNASPAERYTPIYNACGRGHYCKIIKNIPAPYTLKHFVKFQDIMNT